MSLNTTDRAKIELDRLVDMFQKGEAPKALARVVLMCPNMPSSKWTLANRMLAFAQTFEVDNRGFNQWSKVNRWVRKGSKAAYILKPNLHKTFDKETNEEGVRLTGFSTIPIYPVASTDGEPLPELKPAEPPPLIEIAHRWDIVVDYQAFGSGYYGYYAGSVNKIVLCTHDEQVFFHELAHAGHDKVSETKLKGGQDPKQEIVADLCGCVLARIYGRKQANEGETFEYIERYAKQMKKDLPLAILSVLKDVQKVLNLIIETKEVVQQQ